MRSRPPGRVQIARGLMREQRLVTAARRSVGPGARRLSDSYITTKRAGREALKPTAQPPRATAARRWADSSDRGRQTVEVIDDGAPGKFEPGNFVELGQIIHPDNRHHRRCSVSVAAGGRRRWTSPAARAEDGQAIAFIWSSIQVTTFGGSLKSGYSGYSGYTMEEGSVTTVTTLPLEKGGQDQSESNPRRPRSKVRVRCGFPSRRRSLLVRLTVPASRSSMSPPFM